MDLSSDIRRYPSSMVAALLTVSHTCDGVLYLGDDFRNWTTDYLPEEFQRIYFGVRELRQGAQDVLHLIEPEALKRWPRIDSWTHEDFRVGTNKVYKPLSRCLQTLEDIIHILIPITRWAHGKRYSGVNEAGETVTEALAVVKKTADFVNSLSALDNSIMILKAMEARRTHSDRNFDVFKTFDNMDEDEENVSIQTWFRGLDQSTYLDGFCGTIQQRNSLRRSLFGTEAYSRWRIGLGKSLHIHVVNGINTDILCSNITKDLLHSTQLFRRRAAAYFYFGNVDTSTNDLLRTIIPQLLQQISLETTPKDLRSHLANVCGLPKFSNLYALIDGTNSDEDAQNTVLLKLLEYAISGFDVVYLVLNSVEHCTSNPELSEWLGTLMDEKSGRWHVLNTSYGLPTSNSKSTADTATVVIWGHDFPKQNSLRQEVERFDFQNPGIGENLLQWLCVAMRPLTFEEAFELFCISSDAERKPTISEFELALAERFQHLVYVTPRELVSKCPGMIRYIQLQQSVKGIFESGDKATLAKFHHDTSRCCLKYLLKLGLRTSTVATKLSTLAYYAARYWINHMRKAQALGHPKDWMLQHLIFSLFDEKRHNYQMWCCLMDMPKLPRVQYQDFPQDLPEDGCIGGDPSPEEASPEGVLAFPPPLHYAYVNGLKGVIKNLLQNGSDPNAIGWTSVKRYQKSSSSYPFNMSPQQLAEAWTSIRRYQKPLTLASFPMTLMCVVAAVGDVNTIKLLLDAGAEQILQRIVNGRTYELWQGDLIIASYLGDGADVGEMCHGPLTIAAGSGYEICVQVLLDRGLNGPHKNKYLSSALCLAAKNGHRGIVDILLGAGANINQSLAMDPLGQVYEMGFYEVVEMLFPLCNDGVIAALGEFRTQPWAYSEILVRICKAKFPEDTLYAACRDGLTEVVSETITRMAALPTEEWYLKAICIAVEYGRSDIVKVFLELAHGKYISDAGKVYAHALERACSEGMEEIVMQLLEAGANPNGATGSAMHHAAITGKLNIVKLLVEWGASVEGQFYERRPLSLRPDTATLNDQHPFLSRMQCFHHTPLYEAIANGHQDVAIHLLKSLAGTAAASLKGSRKATLLAVAVRTNSVEVITMLLDAGADPSTALEEALRTNSAELITMLLDKGADPNKITTNPQLLPWHGLQEISILGMACELGCLRIVKILVERGAQLLWHKEWSPLHLAAFFHQQEILEYLVTQCGVPLKQQSGLQNALHCVVANDSQELERALECIEILVGAGVNINSKDGRGRTHLHYSLRRHKGHKGISEYFVKRGADVNLKDDEFMSPMDVLQQLQEHTRTFYHGSRMSNLSDWVAVVMVFEEALTKGSVKYLGAFCESHDPGNYA